MWKIIFWVRRISGEHTSVTARHTDTLHGNLIPQIYSLIPTIPNNPHPKYSQPHPLSQIFQKKLTQIQPIQQNKLKWHVTRCPRWLANLLLVDLLTLKKSGVNWILMDLIGVKISHSLGVGGWCGSSQICGVDSGAVVWGFLYVSNSFYTISKLWEGLRLVITVSFDNGVKYNI